MKLHMLFALLVSMLCGQLAAAQVHVNDAFYSNTVVREAHRLHVEAFYFNGKNQAVFLGYKHQYLLPCETEEDLISQINEVRQMDFKAPPTAEIFTYVTITDVSNRIIMEGNPSVMMEKNGRKYEMPWMYLELYPVWDGAIKTGKSEYPATKKTFGKKVSVSLTFNWVDVRGVVQSDPDDLDFVKVYAAPEWNNNPSVETWIPESGRLRLYCRSTIGYKPKWVHVIDPLGYTILPYTDEMDIVDLMSDIELRPGERLKLFFDFDLDPWNWKG